MAEEVPAAAPVKTPATAKEKGSTTRKRSTPARQRNKMTMVKQILEVIAAFKQPKGVSVQAIKKGLRGKGVDVGKQNNRINLAIRRLERKGEIVQVRGTGASGSFKLPKIEAKKDTRKSKSKRARTNSPSRKPAAKKSKVSKPGTPKKGGKKSKKPAAKKAPAKKSAAKKVAKKTLAKKAALKRKAKPSQKTSGKATSKVQKRSPQKKVTQRKSATSKKPSFKGKK